MSDQQILPCVMCDQHHQQMLMLSCMHDPCINCAAINYCSTQPSGSHVYVCAKCSDQTELDSSSIVELQRVYQQLKAKKKFDYRRNLGGLSQNNGQNQPYSTNLQKNLNPQYAPKIKTQNATGYVGPSTSYPQQYTPISQPSYPSNPYNNIIARKSQQQLYMCQTHPEQQLSYFCFDCRNPICPECAIHGSHREHEVQTTRKSIKIIKGSLSDCQNRLAAETSGTSVIRDGLKNKVKDMAETSKKDKQLIHDHFQSLMAILQQKQKQFQRVLDHTSETNASIVKSQVAETEQVIDSYGMVRKNIDSTMKKDDLTILQQFSKRQKQSKTSIQSNKGKSYHKQAEGIKVIDYGLFKDEMEQLSGIMQSLQLTTKSHRS